MTLITPLSKSMLTYIYIYQGQRLLSSKITQCDHEHGRRDKCYWLCWVYHLILWKWNTVQQRKVPANFWQQTIWYKFHDLIDIECRSTQTWLFTKQYKSAVTASYFRVNLNVMHCNVLQHQGFSWQAGPDSCTRFTQSMSWLSWLLGLQYYYKRVFASGRVGWYWSLPKGELFQFFPTIVAVFPRILLQVAKMGF